MADMTEVEVRSVVKASRLAGAQEWHVAQSKRGAGALVIRTNGGDGRWYFRYTSPAGKRETLPMAWYTERRGAGPEGSLTLADARARYNEWAAKLITPETADLRAHHAEVAGAAQKKLDAEKAASAAAERIAELSAKYSLAALCEAYAGHLAARGKVSAASVRSVLQIHVINSFPELAAKPANEISKRECALMVRSLVESKKLRTAGMVRSHLHAAYRLAQTAETDTTAPAALIAFGIEVNPIAGVRAPVVGERHRVLRSDELRSFMARLESKSGVTAELVRAALLLGGQRPAQLARATMSDFDQENSTLTLSDCKGRRAQARRHVLPLAGAALEKIQARAAVAHKQRAEWLFSHDGAQHADIVGSSKIITDISRSMVAAGEAREPFQMRDLRRTAETMLAALGISKDTRAQLLSHGLSGVQSQRYDRHDYLEEKRAALRAWMAKLEQFQTGEVHGANVVALRQGNK